MLNQGACNKRLGTAFHVLNYFTQNPDTAALFGIQDAAGDALTHAWSVYHAAHQAATNQMVANANALTAADQCAVSFQTTKAAQTRLTALGRVMITTPSDRDRLGLSGRRAEGLGAWRVQAELFHVNLNAADRALLARVAVFEDELDRVAAMLATLGEQHAACVAAKAAARAATAAKRRAFAALADLMSLIIGVARALEPDMPELIEDLNMKPDGRRTPPRLTPPPPDPQPEPRETVANATAPLLETRTSSPSTQVTTTGPSNPHGFLTLKKEKNRRAKHHKTGSKKAPLNPPARR